MILKCKKINGGVSSHEIQNVVFFYLLYSSEKNHKYDRI